MWKKVLIGAAAVVLGVAALLSWYRLHYSMGVAASYEIDPSNPAHRVLIATQGSPFKDAVVSGIVDQLKQQNNRIDVVDVSKLADVDEGQWDAIVVLHTWEYGQPPAEAEAFIDRVKDKGKLVVLATSGQGTQKIEGVDAISSASVMSDAPARAAEIVSRLEPILARESASP
jgi:hypothetical protein